MTFYQVLSRLQNALSEFKLNALSEFKLWHEVTVSMQLRYQVSYGNEWFGLMGHEKESDQSETKCHECSEKTALVFLFYDFEFSVDTHVFII